LLLTLPAAAGLIVLAQPILAALFQRGAFGPAATAATAAALTAYAAGLPAFVMVKVLAPGFYAHRNTRTPVKVAIGALALNLALTLLLMRPFAHVGVAAALSASGWTQALALLALLRRHGHFRLDRHALRQMPRIAAASLGMAGLLVLLRLVLDPILAGPGMLRLAALVALVVAGLVAFVLFALAFGIVDWRELRGRLRRQPA
jgi:putative peptidoglycan lipid II flippase